MKGFLPCAAGPDGSFGPVEPRTPAGSDVVIEVVYMQCSRLFKGLERTVLSMVL